MNVDRLRRLSGALQAGDRDAAWLGGVLGRWLHDDGADLLDLLGVRPVAGCRMTAQALIRQQAQDAALLALSRVAGSDAKALALLRGGPCLARCRDALDDALALDVPRSRDAFTRARARAARAT